MYSVVLATMMTVTPATQDWHGNAWGGCWGCHGCCGCYGCWGCWGCWGCCGCWGSCSGCCGCCGCWGYSSWGCYGCSGCCGTVYYPGCCGGTVYVVPETPKQTLPPPKREQKEEQKKEGVSRVTIRALADARISVDGQPLTLSGTTEIFETPALEPGQSYSYVFRAEGNRGGQTVVRERKVKLRAGESVEVDFSDLYAKAAARVTIVMPEDAKLIVENVTYPQGTSKRTFETPDLEAGRHYTYTMRAEANRDGRLLKQEKRVDVEAGKNVTVEFKDLSAIQAAQR
jgi:uncharacterized protein (TIGR03000 family)